MERSQRPTLTRRRALKTLATAGLIGLAGCTNEGSDTPSSTLSETVGTHRTTRQHTETTTRDPTTPEQPSEQPQAWSELELSGTPAYHDDPNWRMNGHDTGLTFHNPHADGPDSEPMVRWTFEGEGGPVDTHKYYQPLIVDGTVYVTVVPKDGTGGLAAIDAETGESEMLIETSKFLRRPTIFDGTIYTLLGDSVAAFDLSDGTQLWEADDLLGPLFGPLSEPVCVDGVVVTGRGSVILGLDAATGEKLWQVGENKTLQAAAYIPVIADGMVAQSDRRSVYDLQTGEQRGELPCLIAYQSINDGLVIGWDLSGEKNLGTGKTIAVDWNTLEKVWTKPDNKRSISKMSTSVGNTYLSVEEIEEETTVFIVARDLTTGEQIWQIRRQDTAPTYITTDGKRAYCAYSFHNDFYALDPDDGSVQWEFSPDDDAAGTGIALADDLLVVSDGVGNLWALE